MSDPINTPSEREQTAVSVSRNTFNVIIVAITFLIVGGVVGALALQQIQPGLTEQDVEAIAERVAQSVVAEASLSAAVDGEGGMSREAVEEIVRGIVADLEPGQPDRFEHVDDDPYIGPEDAPVVIVEFSAYACPFCARHFEQTFIPLLDNYGEYIRYVYRDYPIINPNISFPAALASQCAHEQGEFWDYHELLFANQSQLGDAYFREAAIQVALDLDEFEACLEEERYLDEVNNDYIDGTLLNLSGTPAFYVNGQFVSGAQPYDVFERLVLRELERAGIDPSS